MNCYIDIFTFTLCELVRYFVVGAGVPAESRVYE